VLCVVIVTKFMGQIPFEKLIVPHVVKKLPTYYVARKSITRFEGIKHSIIQLMHNI